MTEIDDSLRLLYEAAIEKRGDEYVIPIPTELVEQGSVSSGCEYRVALLDSLNSQSPSDASSESTATPSDSSGSVSPSTVRGAPVEEGEVRTVTIDTLGDQGDGIARVDRGFIVIVSDTQPGDRVDVEITDVKDSVAFADPVSEPEVR